MNQELTIDEAAKRLAVHRTTVWKWIRGGRLASRVEGLAHFHYISMAELETFAQRNNYPFSAQIACVNEALQK